MSTSKGKTAKDWQKTPAKPEWGEHAFNIWGSLADSKQTPQWQASDWAYAWMVCDLIEEATGGDRISAALLRELNVSIAAMGLTQGQRNLSKVEIPEDEPEEDQDMAGVMAEYMANTPFAKIMGGPATVKRQAPKGGR